MNYIKFNQNIHNIMFDYLIISSKKTRKLFNITLCEMLFYGGSTYKYSLFNYKRNKNTKNWYYREFIYNKRYISPIIIL